LTNLAELMNLKGRRVLVTGAAGALGQTICDVLGEMGAGIILVDRSEMQLSKLAEDLKKRWQIPLEQYVIDLEDQSERLFLIKTMIESNQGLDVLINNAAFVGTSEMTGWAVPFEEQTLQAWRRALEVNLTAPFDLCKGLAPLLKKTSGNIINIGSIYGEYAPDWRLYAGTSMSNPAAYGAAKGGLIQLTRWLATTLAPNIRVNSISPGGIERGQPEIFIERYKAKTPLGRMACEDDFRGAIAYLASNLSSYVTGQNLRVDGGWGIW